MILCIVVSISYAAKLKQYDKIDIERFRCYNGNSSLEMRRSVVKCSEKS